MWLSRLLYNAAIRLYYFGIWLASPFKPKAKQWINGRKETFPLLKEKRKEGDRYVWFHCASLGEFEQARPLIDEIKSNRPELKIAVSFFSPSGYEVRKYYINADLCFYLPVDTQANAQRFIEVLKPELAIFIRYEFWLNTLAATKASNIPILSVAALFRPNQMFFRTGGGLFRYMLSCFSHFFVQNKESQKLLEEIGIADSTIAPDTRFDRVAAIAEQAKQFELVDAFCNKHQILIAGSTWPADHKLLAEYINGQFRTDFRYIIAPHNIIEDELDELEESLNTSVIRYSKASDLTVGEHSVLIIDNIGMLSSLYKYGHIAYIGGGFGAAVHSVSEAAVFGIPVMFGPNHQKNNEAQALLEAGGAFCIHSVKGLRQTIRKAMDEENYATICETNAKYVQDNTGATETILKFLTRKKFLPKT